ncbi:condensation domain-containing protein [Streptomyces sp. NPDC058440]|uniref:condensation domain-containing protein n=1 Tax=Streptomyces sp. NPDC058440 TaxID=3346501 RepID=UPI00365937A9
MSNSPHSRAEVEQNVTGDLSDAARALMERRLAGLAAPAQEAPALRPERPPLAPGQRRLWFIHQLSRDSLAYNVPTAYRLRGRLDAEALDRAVRHVVRRHEVLRTCYPADEDGEPFQRVLEADTADGRTLVVRHDLGSVPDPVAEALRLAGEEADHRFSLDSEGPLRVWLARLGQDDHVLGIVVHHIAFDRESLAILATEISAAYRAETAAEKPGLPPIEVQYADFAAWQRGLTDTAEYDRALGFWRDTLRSLAHVLELPADHERPKEPTYEAGEAAIRIEAETADRLRALSAERGASLFMTCLAAFQGLLSRYTGVPDLAVGCPVNGRVKVAYEGLIGFFANSLPIGVRLGDDPPFRSMVDRAREALLSAHAHQSVPFDRIVRELSPLRDISRNPLVQVWFDLDAGGTGTATDLLDLPGVSAEYFAEGRVRTRFDAEMHLGDRADGTITGRLLYARDLFEVATAESFCEHYTNFLTAVAADPELRLSRVPIFSARQLSTLLDDWSAGGD